MRHPPDSGNTGQPGKADGAGTDDRVGALHHRQVYRGGFDTAAANVHSAQIGLGTSGSQLCTVARGEVLPRNSSTSALIGLAIFRAGRALDER